MQQRIISRVIGNLVERPAVEVPHLRARYRSQFLSETKNIAERYFSYSFLLLEPTKSGKNEKFEIFEAKKLFQLPAKQV